MTAEEFWMRVDTSGDCWEWPSINGAGYGQVWFDKKIRLAHRVAWELTHGPIKNDGSYHGICVCHRCDNPRRFGVSQACISSIQRSGDH